MRYGICVPNLGEFADVRQTADLARRAEDAGWDGFFTWDHVVFAYGTPDTADPWVPLTAIALATSRIRLGPLVTPVARRRPGTLARQATSAEARPGGWRGRGQAPASGTGSCGGPKPGRRAEPRGPKKE